MPRFSKSTKNALIVIEVVLLLGLILGICGIIEPDEEYGAAGGWFVTIGVAFFMIAIPLKLMRDDKESACPQCRELGAMESESKAFIRSEAIIKTEEYYQGQRVTPYQVTGHRNYYLVTRCCSHCGYRDQITIYEDKWDV